ncbi:MAG: family 10 glycosylhydrolase, partial [Candidatus Omnitrophica bacterium]|nr:family 10 glycosylhydrolase [Candidatus Omnitrophota bacterium]
SQYQSEIVPQNQFEDWDPLGALIGEARKRDLGVYIAVPVLVCGHDEPRGILAKHPEWAVRDENGTPLGYICGGNLEARKWVISVVEELVRKYQPEGVILDYLRFPNKPVDVDPTTRERFLREARIESYELTQRDGPWQDFKERSLIELAGQIREGIERVKPGTTIGIYTWGPHVASNHYVSQDWVTMTRQGYLDLINVSGYLYRQKNGEDFLELFEEKMREALSLLEGVDRPIDFAFVLGVITSHGELHSAEEIEQYLEAADRAGMKGISVFTLTYLQPYIDDLLERGNWMRHLGFPVEE